MLMTALITTVCIAGIGLYIRFLVALSKESKPPVSGYWTQPRLISKANTVVELYPRRAIPRAGVARPQVRHSQLVSDVGFSEKG